MLSLVCAISLYSHHNAGHKGHVLQDTLYGVQGFHKALLDKAQNMAVFLDEFTIQEQFLKRIPYKMLMTLIIEGVLALEANTIKEFVAKDQAYENSIKTAVHYVGHSHNCMLHSRIVAHKQAYKAVWKELEWGTVVPHKP